MTRVHPARRRIPAVAAFVFTLLALVAAATAGNLGLKREPVKDPWGKEGKPSAAARGRIEKALEKAGVPADAAPWHKLAEEYSLLDNKAAAEPKAYEGQAAWFTHGMPHLLDILHLATKNEPFIKEVWEAKGLTGDAASQAYRDLILAIIGHDSQQGGFASPDAAVRKNARDNHALSGGIETAKAYKAAHGDNPGGDVRAVTVGLAAAGHSKSAVDLKDPAKMKEVATTIATKLGATLTAAELNQVIADAKPVAAMVGALDALRDRGSLGGAVAPCGEGVIYRLREGAEPALEVYNTKTDKVLQTFEGVNHRTYVEAHTRVLEIQLELGRLQMSVEFADAAISDVKRLEQIDDIGNDLRRTGIPVDVTYKTFAGGTEKKTYAAE
jgi:hypothetical protein